jgi:hypothetical protein
MKWATACSLCYLFGLVVTGLLVGSIGPSVGPLARAVHRTEHAFSLVWIARGFGFLGGIVVAAQVVNWFPRHGTATRAPRPHVWCGWVPAGVVEPLGSGLGLGLALLAE